MIKVTFFSNEYDSEVTGTLVRNNVLTYVLSVVKERERRYRRKLQGLTLPYYDIPEHIKIIRLKKHRALKVTA